MPAVAVQLMTAVLSRSPTPFDPVLMPTVLVKACVGVLEADGAGLSLIGDLRIPLAASSDEVRKAELLQTSLGEGPCLTAVASGEPVAAGPAQMMRQWPLFHSEIARQTPFQSVVSLPLGVTNGQLFGALDLYSVSPVPDLDLLSQPTRNDIVRVVSAFLTGIPLNDLLTDDAVPVSIDRLGDGVAARMNIWTAVGMLMAATGLGQPEALALLRGHAFTHTTTLDDVARQLTSNRLEVEQLVD